MKIEIDDRPSSNTDPECFYAIRLFPETNKEMADLERAMVIKYQPKEYLRISTVGIHYAIIFEEKKEN